MKEYRLREKIPDEINENLKAYPELLRVLLFYRGIETSDKAYEFLNPDYEKHVHNPFLLKDMDRAVERILRAVKNNERILIYSDYDADGIPAAVVMNDFFNLIGYTNFEIYIPHRHNEGYGLHLEAIETFVPKGVKLLITLDCGIVDHAEVAHAKSLGIDVIITDHHSPRHGANGADELPEAYATLNPKRADCGYPYDFLCGAGVAFKLVQALLSTVKSSADIKEGQEKWLLDMVGLATLSDMVSLTGENRTLAHYGLKVLRKSRRPGFVKLLSIMKVDREHITEDDVGFMITPRINAASRMGVPMDAFLLLSTRDETQARELATHLDTINKERKILVSVTVKEIKKVMSEREDHFALQSVIVLGNPSWRPAILGLAANTIAEEYNKPVFLWGREDGKDIKGSCRSDGVVHLVRLMEKAKSHFSEFGGHAFSGGFAVVSDMIHTLEETLVTGLKELGHETAINEPINIDSKLTLDDVTPNLFFHIDKLAPFGIDNPKPVFMFENIVPTEVKSFGKANDHLEITFLNSQKKKVRAIGFFSKAEDYSPIPKKGIPLTLIASIEKSFFGRYPELRLRIVDIV